MDRCIAFKVKQKSNFSFAIFFVSLALFTSVNVQFFISFALLTFRLSLYLSILSFKVRSYVHFLCFFFWCMFFLCFDCFCYVDETFWIDRRGYGNPTRTNTDKVRPMLWSMFRNGKKVYPLQKQEKSIIVFMSCSNQM